MSSWSQGLAGAIMFSFPVVAWGHGFLRPPPTVAYYYPAPVPYVPVLTYNPYTICVPLPSPLYPSVPPPSVPSRTYAPPTAAPPSAGPATAEPPLAPQPTPAKPSEPTPGRGPGFGESTSFYDAYSVAPQNEAAQGGERYAADFWNLTNRDLILRVDTGPPQVLPRGKSRQIVAGRQFTWQVEGRPAQTTQLSDGEKALQIVIRH